ncbi:MAG: SHD1 domain-containing protein [Rubripirellula sp.]
MRVLTLIVIAIGSGFCCRSVDARTWTSAKGNYQLEADAIALNDSTIILKKESGDLVAVEIDELSTDDQEHVKSKEVGDELSDSISKMQTWTSNDGVKIRARVLAFGRKDLSISRVRGKVVVNGTPFAKVDPLHQQLVLKVMSKLEGRPFDDQAQLTTWAKGLGSESKVYPLEGVLMELESGDMLAVPFFLFGAKERKVLEPGWKAWVAAGKDEQTQQRESLMMQSEAMEYQRDQSQRQQVEILKLNMLAAATGLTSIWEVGLSPGAGVYGRRTSVMVTAQNSDIASQIALQKYPGYTVFGVRKASN